MVSKYEFSQGALTRSVVAPSLDSVRTVDLPQRARRTAHDYLKCRRTKVKEASLEDESRVAPVEFRQFCGKRGRSGRQQLGLVGLSRYLD